MAAKLSRRPSSAESPGGDGKRRRLCWKQTGTGEPTTLSDPWDTSSSIEKIFGKSVSGAALIERIFETYGDPKGEHVDVPWFSSDGRENIIADPLNRPLQQSTVVEYTQRIFTSGLADDCSGTVLGQSKQV